MSVAYPSCLYIRVERELRAALLREAATEGMTASELARRALAAGLVSIRSRPTGPGDDPRPPSAPAASMRTAA